MECQNELCDQSSTTNGKPRDQSAPVYVIRETEERRRGRPEKHKKVPMKLKLDVIKLLDRGLSHRQVSQELGIHHSLVHHLGNRKQRIIEDCTNYHERFEHKRRGKYELLDKAMTEWYIMTRNYGVPITDHDLSIKARQFSLMLGYVNVKPAQFWLDTWKGKNNVVYTQDLTNCQIECEKACLRDINNYDVEDIYTVAEVGLQSSGHEGRLTLLIACNQPGTEKCPLVVVSKDQRPLNVFTLPCEFKTEVNAMMSTDVFVCWLLKFDRKMKEQNRDVLLILEESPVHLHETSCDLSNVKLLYLHPARSDLTLPSDAGISHTLLQNYLKELTQYQQLYPKQIVSLLDDLHMLTKAWLKLDCDTIKTAFLSFPGQILDKSAVESWEGEAVKAHDMLTDEEICEKVKSGVRECAFEDNPKSSAIAVEWCSAIANSEEALHSVFILRKFMEKTDISDFTNLYNVETDVYSKVYGKESKGFNEENFYASIMDEI